MEESLRHGLEKVGFFREGEFRLWRRWGRGLANGDPLAGPATDGEAFEDVVIVGRAGLAARLARGTVLRRGGGLSITQLQSEGYTGGQEWGVRGARGAGERGETEGGQRTKEMRAGMVSSRSLALALALASLFGQRVCEEGGGFSGAVAGA